MPVEVAYNAAVETRRPRVGDEPSPDWLLTSILKDISARNDRYARLRRYTEGDPPKAQIPAAVKDEWVEFENFRRASRTNFASLVTAACLDKTIIGSFRTSAQGDEDGDEAADELWEVNDMPVKSDRVMFDMFTYGRGFLLADPISGKARDFRPWQAGCIRDMADEPLAGVTLEHNPVEGLDYAYLWQRDMGPHGIATGKVRVHIAVRERENKTGRGTQFEREVPLGTYLPRNWYWWKTVETDLESLPLTEFENRDGVGEFEHHTDVLDRINHMILQRVVIVTMQAFRQRAIKGKLPRKDEKGQEIDYNALFPASPGALWVIGEEAEIWESQQTTIQDILLAVKDDVRDLSSVTRTPMTYFQPDAANGSAEGASLANDAYTSKIRDRQKRNAGRWRQFMANMFLITGDRERANVRDIEVLYVQTDQRSLTDRFSAASQGASIGIPLKTLMREVLGWDSKTIRAAEIERIAQTLTAAAATPVAGQEAQTPLQRSSAARTSMEKTNGANSSAGSSA